MHDNRTGDLLDATVALVPAYNEAGSILAVVQQLKDAGVGGCIVAIDCNSRDNTASLLNSTGIYYTVSQKTGYDFSMIEAARRIPEWYPQCQYIFCTDAGKKFTYESLPQFVKAFNEGADMVLGIRTQTVGMLWHQRLGTQVILFLINILFNSSIKDISPFRMIRYSKFLTLNMSPRRFRWPSEMLVKCLALGYQIVQIPIISGARSAGTSNVSGKLYNSIKAGLDMFSSLRFVLYRRNNHSPHISHVK